MTNSERKLLIKVAKLVGLSFSDQEAEIKKLIRRVHVEAAQEEKKRVVRIQREADLDTRLKQATV